MSSTNHITRQPVPPTDSVRVKAAVAAHEAADAATDRRVDTTFDKFHDRYSTRSLGLKTSPVRALFAVANRPEVVSLAGGMPNIADLPLDVVSESLKELVDTRGTVVMQYGSGQGEPEMRKHICEVMAVEGLVADPDDVTVTCGSQQGLDLVTRIFATQATSLWPSRRLMSGRSIPSPRTKLRSFTSTWTTAGWFRNPCVRK